MYRTKSFTTLYSYLLDNIKQTDLPCIDITTNLKIIRQLMGYFSTIGVSYTKRNTSSFY